MSKVKTWKKILLSKIEIIPYWACWEWTSSKDKDGYGKISRKIPGTRKAVYLRAHRVSYEIFKGPVGNLQVLHTCDNPSCINPAHLFLGTSKDNMMDKVAKGRSNSPSGEQHWTKRKKQLRNAKGQFSK